MNLFEKNKVLKILIAINLLLLSLYLVSKQLIAGYSWTITHWFDFDSEATIPAWFSSAQLLILFLLTLIYSTMVKEQLLARFYMVLSSIFLFFSVDEASMIHETLTELLKKVSVRSPLPNAHGIWILVYPSILFVLAYTIRKELLVFFKEKVGRTIFILGATVFVTGGVVFEIIGYYTNQNVSSGSIQYLIQVSFEESFELLGESIMIFSLMCKIDSIQPIFKPNRAL